MRKAIKTLGLMAMMLVMATGCSTAPSSSGARADLQSEARETIAMFRSSDPTIDKFFNTSVGYAVFPSIGKGGLVLGGAYGRGALFENGTFTSYCDLSQATVGLQIGGQEYSEIIFFENQGALSEFKNNAMTFAAQASAVAVSAGVAANRDYDGGVAVFVGDQDGLMAEASIGGQKFSVVSASDDAFAGDPRSNQRPDVYATPNNNNNNNYNNNNNNNYNDKNHNDKNYNENNSNTNNSNKSYSNYDQDTGWRNDSDYNRRYDASQSRVIQGQVTAINDLYPTRDSGKGRQLTLRGVDGETYTVHLGPVSYLDRSDSLSIREGDRVTVTGSPINHEGQQVIVARDITNSQAQKMELRGSDGSPRWNTTTSNPQR